MTNAQNLVTTASRYLGKMEKAGNTGFQDPAFEKEMIKSGWYFKAPWCAFFVINILRQILTGPLLTAALKQFNGSAKQSFENVKKAGVFATGDIPEDGCICVCLLGHGPSGHMYIVNKAKAAENTCSTIEGNTNAAGSREGNQVAKKLRTVKRDFQPNGLNVLGYIYLREKQ